MSRCPAPLADAKGGSNGGQDELRIAQWRQINEDDAVAKHAPQLCADLEGEAGLARAPGSGQRDQPTIGVPHKR